jgi:hypothetical protein
MIKRFIIKIKDSGDDNYGQYTYLYEINTAETETKIRARFNDIKARKWEDGDDEIGNASILDEMQEEGTIIAWSSILEDFILEN